MNSIPCKVLISSHHPCYHSGFGKIAHGISKVLTNKGFEVRFVDIVGFEVKNIPEDFSAKVYVQPGTYDSNRGKQAFSKAMDEYKPDVLITVGDVWDHYYVPSLVRKQATVWIAYIPVEQAPLMKSIVTTVVDELSGKKFNVQKYVQEPDYVVCYNSFSFELMKEFVPERCLTYIHHAVDTEVFRIKKDIQERGKKKVFGERNIPGVNPFVVSTICRNNPRKGLDLMFIGWSKFINKLQPEDRKSARLYIHAPDEEGGYCFDDIVDTLKCRDTILRNNKINAKEGIPEERLVEILNVSDLYLNTSRAEGFGIPIIEAMACGAPSYVTDYAGPKCIAEIIGNKDIIRTIKVGHYTINAPSSAFWAEIDTDYLSNLLLNYFQWVKKADAKTLQEKRVRLSNTAKEQFSWEVIGNRWIELVSELAKKRQRKIRLFKV